MLIAYLGWGSLVWDPRALPIRGIWFEDGPLLSIEYARESNGGRITLVLVPGDYPVVRTLWAIASKPDLAAARVALRERERILQKNEKDDIGEWRSGQKGEGVVKTISRWADTLGLEAVIWTNLPAQFKGKKRVPTENEVVEHLAALSFEQRKHAEHYIRMTPRQVDTQYRRVIETRFGWTPTGIV